MFDSQVLSGWWWLPNGNHTQNEFWFDVVVLLMRIFNQTINAWLWKRNLVF